MQLVHRAFTCDCYLLQKYYRAVGAKQTRERAYNNLVKSRRAAEKENENDALDKQRKLSSTSKVNGREIKVLFVKINSRISYWYLLDCFVL